MSKFIGVILGILEIAVGIITENPALIVSGVLMLAGSVASLLLAPTSANGKNTRQASALTLKFGETDRVALFGEAAIAGSLVDAFNHGGDYGTDWETLVIALADHYCEGLTGFFVNDKFETFAGDGAVSGYNGQLEVYFRHGNLVQTLPSVVTANGPGWSASDYGAGVCQVVVSYKADAPDAQNPVWPGGRPGFLWVVKGKRCYVARKDSTVAGGSGAHRWTDPTTWEWTDNLIDCRYNWARGVYAGDQVSSSAMLLVGRGLSAIEQPPENTFAPANVCDELVGGQKLYRCDGSVTSGQKYLDVENEFAIACGGLIVTREGAVEIEPGQAYSPSFFFTDDDIVTGSTVQWNSGFVSETDSSWVNTVVGQYVEPAQKWQSTSAPVRRDPADIVSDEGQRTQTLTLDLVKRVVQAGMIAEFTRRLGRLWGRGTATLGPRYAGVEEGDWGQWQSNRRFGGAIKTFRVESFKLDQKWQNTLTLREIGSSVFASVPSIGSTAGSFSSNPHPTLTAPAAADWTLSAVAIDGLAALQLAGAVSMSAVTAIVFEHRVYNVLNGPDDNWVSDGVEAATIALKTIRNVLPVTNYEVSVRYRVTNELTPRRILAAGATDGSASGLSLQIESPVIVYAAVTGTPKSGELTKAVVLKLLKNGTMISSGVSWSASRTAGNAAFTVGGTGAGALDITGPNDSTFAAENDFTVTASYGGIDMVGTLKVLRQDDPPSNTGTSGSSSSGTSGSTTTLGTTTGTAYDFTNAVSPVLTAVAGSTGQVTCTAPIGFKRAGVTLSSGPAGETGAAGKWRWRVPGGTFADIAAEVVTTVTALTEFDAETGKYLPTAGNISVTQTKTGLTPGVSYEFQFAWRRDDVAPTAENIYRTSGTLQAAGS